MENQRKYRVYVHIVPNGKRYVGSTTLPWSRRWQRGMNYNNSPEFIADVKKFGWDSLKHRLYDNSSELYTLEEANEMERGLIKLWETTNSDKGYNKESGGFTDYEIGHLTRDKMSAAKFRPVIQYTPNGHYVDEYVSIEDAAKITGITRTGISNVLAGRTKTSGRYTWRYKDEVLEEDGSIAESITIISPKKQRNLLIKIQSNIDNRLIPESLRMAQHTNSLEEEFERALQAERNGR